MSHKEETLEGYPFEKKKRLASKISDMRDKPTLRKVRDIILAENPSIATKKSNNGYLMFFQNYTEETYMKLERLLVKLEKERLEQQTRSITETSEHMLLSSEDPNADYTMSRTRLRYSNREKRLIKRQQREDDIINENTVRTVNSDDDDNEDDNEDAENVEDVETDIIVKKNAPKVASKAKATSKVSKESETASSPVVAPKKTTVKSASKVTKTMKTKVSDIESATIDTEPIKISAKASGKASTAVPKAASKAATSTKVTTSTKPTTKSEGTATKVTAKSSANVKPKNADTAKKQPATIFTKMKA